MKLKYSSHLYTEMREYYIILFPFGTENETMLSELLFVSIVSATSTCSYFIVLITTWIQYLVATNIPYRCNCHTRMEWPNMTNLISGYLEQSGFISQLTLFDDGETFATLGQIQTNCSKLTKFCEETLICIVTSRSYLKKTIS